MLTAPGPGALEQRLVDAALACVSRWGVAKTSLDDVARQAGCSRATAYRAFAGGKDALVETVARVELGRFFDGLAQRMAEAPTLEEQLVAAIHEAGTRIAGHAALQYLLAYEPEVILPRLAFDQCDAALAVVVDFARPFLARFLDGEAPAHAAELAARLVLSYAILPSSEVDLTDLAAVRRLVRTFVLPAFAASATAPPDPSVLN